MGKKSMSLILREVLLVIGSLFLIVFMCRLWPLLLLMIIAVFVALIVLLFKQSNKVEVVEAKPIKTEAPEIKIPTPKDVYTLAYSVILRQITALVQDKYPNARWIWESPNAKERIEKGDELYILLNSAGGYNRAKVIVTNLQVTDILFGVALDDAEEQNENEDTENEESMEENYELLAFEWVESHIVELNARINEAIGKGKSELLLKSDELPTRESWDDIRFELEKENIADTKCIPAGILIKLTR